MTASATTKEPIPAFSALVGQDKISALLQRTVRENRVSHAYLFVGPAGAGQTEAALSLAKCLVCGKGGCNACEECIRVDHRTHPDVHWISPEGASGYVVEQIQSIIEDVSLTPMRAQSKVYIFDRVESLSAVCANALLKTIEEPPPGVVFILMARSTDLVLPTIVSRCQCLAFRVTDTREALRSIMMECGISDEAYARIALDVAGTPQKACAFIKSKVRPEVRKLVIRTFDELPRDDDWDVICAAKSLMEASSDKYRKKQNQKKTRSNDEAVEADLTEEEREKLAKAEHEKEFLSAKALKILEQRDNRELTARERSGMIELVSAAQSLLRDVLISVSGAQAPLVNVDSIAVIERLATQYDTAGALKALDACNRAIQDFSYNVTPQLTLEVMLFSCKEALCPPSFR